MPITAAAQVAAVSGQFMSAYRSAHLSELTNHQNLVFLHLHKFAKNVNVDDLVKRNDDAVNESVKDARRKTDANVKLNEKDVKKKKTFVVNVKNCAENERKLNVKRRN